MAPRIGGIPEVVEDGVSGLLYDKLNGCEQAVSLAERLRGPARQKIIEEGLVRADLFPEDRMVEEYERIYMSLAEQVTKRYDPTRRSLTAAALWAQRRVRRHQSAAGRPA